MGSKIRYTFFLTSLWGRQRKLKETVGTRVTNCSVEPWGWEVIKKAHRAEPQEASSPTSEGEGGQLCPFLLMNGLPNHLVKGFLAGTYGHVTNSSHQEKCKCVHFHGVSLKGRPPYYPSILLSAQNLEEIAGDPEVLPHHEKNLKLAASTENSRAGKRST